MLFEMWTLGVPPPPPRPLLAISPVLPYFPWCWFFCEYVAASPPPPVRATTLRRAHVLT